MTSMSLDSMLISLVVGIDLLVCLGGVVVAIVTIRRHLLGSILGLIGFAVLVGVDGVSLLQEFLRFVNLPIGLFGLGNLAGMILVMLGLFLRPAGTASRPATAPGPSFAGPPPQPFTGPPPGQVPPPAGPAGPFGPPGPGYPASDDRPPPPPG